MTPDHSLLLAYYASDGANCRRDRSTGSALSPEDAMIAVQIAYLTGEERRMLALGPEVREAALQLGQQRFEVWERENPQTVSACRKAVGQVAKDELGSDAPVAPVHGTDGAPLRLS
ncbi:MAG: hypothetical protein AAGK37_05775 [Pseudomonadota bacterium]